MRLIRNRLAGPAAALLVTGALAVTPAVAQTTAPSTAPAPAAAPTKVPPGVESHITTLKKQLKITAAEEGEWDAFADAMRSNAEQIDALARDRKAKLASMSAVENMRSYEEITDAQADGMKKLIPAFSALYDSMSDAQQKNADAIFAQRALRHVSRRKS